MKRALLPAPGELQRLYRLYLSWGHTPVSAYIEARKHFLAPGRMYWFFLRMLDCGLYRDPEPRWR